jgi:thymidylate kinase
VRIVALEGLSGVGKSTLAPLVARRLDAELLPAIPDDLDAQRKQVDDTDNPTLRHLFYVWAIATTCQRVHSASEDALWVVESYLGRTMAYHLGMGSTLWLAPWSLVPEPRLSVMLSCAEPVRRERLRQRGTPTYWQQRAEDAIERIRDAYRPYSDVQVPNDRDSPDVTADRIARLVTSKLGGGRRR